MFALDGPGVGGLRARGKEPDHGRSGFGSRDPERCIGDRRWAVCAGRDRPRCGGHRCDPGRGRCLRQGWSPRWRVRSMMGAAEVAVSADSRYAFVTFDKTSRLAVFALDDAGADQVSGRPLGAIALGRAPVALALSPDQRWLYVTSQSAAGGAPDTARTLSGLDVARLTTDPTRALIASTEAGCSPVPVTLSTDDATTWGQRPRQQCRTGVLGREAAHRAPPRSGRDRAGRPTTRQAHPDQRRPVASGRRLQPLEPHRTSDLAIVDTRAALTGLPALSTERPQASPPRPRPNPPTGHSRRQQLRLSTVGAGQPRRHALTGTDLL